MCRCGIGAGTGTNPSPRRNCIICAGEAARKAEIGQAPLLGKLKELLDLFASEDVEATPIGHFANDGVLRVRVPRMERIDAIDDAVFRRMNDVDFAVGDVLDGGKDGLVHVSEIRNERVEKVSDVLSEAGLTRDSIEDAVRGATLVLKLSQ